LSDFLISYCFLRRIHVSCSWSVDVVRKKVTNIDAGVNIESMGDCGWTLLISAVIDSAAWSECSCEYEPSSCKHDLLSRCRVRVARARRFRTPSMNSADVLSTWHKRGNMRQWLIVATEGIGTSTRFDVVGVAAPDCACRFV
jgi:hypothetical protein